MKHCLDCTQPYEGIIPMLKALAARGVKMAIVSNKLQPAVEQLNLRFFSQYITLAVGESATVRRKPAPDAVEAAMKALGSQQEETLYVGDSEVDIETAANAGIRCVGVLWGFRDEDFLRKNTQPFAISSTPANCCILLIGQTTRAILFRFKFIFPTRNGKQAPQVKFRKIPYDKKCRSFTIFTRQRYKKIGRSIIIIPMKRAFLCSWTT